MQYVYPKPQEVGISIPPDLIKSRFTSGFEHALRGGQITKVEHLRRSFRFGFRAGKLYCRELRRGRGIVDFPMRARVRSRARF